MSSPTESRLSRTSAATGTRTRAATVTRYAETRRGAVAGAVFGVRRATRVGANAVRRAVEWTRDTVSPAGLVLAIAVIGGVIAGVGFGWVEAWVVAAIAALLLLACIPFLLGAHDYRLELVLDRDRVVAGSTVGGHLDLVNRGERASLPGVVDIPVGRGLVEVHVPLLRAGAQHRENLTIGAERRGVIDVGPMTISRGDPLGILHRDMSWPDVQRVYVHPVTVAIPSTSAGLIRDLEGTPTSDLTDSDLSFHAVRDYVAGDSQRHVHWKATARTGKLMVRQFEESRHARIAILLDLDIAEFESDDEFEMAVSAASSLGLNGVREGRDVLVAVSAPIPEFSRDAVMSINTVPTQTPKAMLDGMAAIESRANVMRLEAVTALTAQSFPDLSIAFLVTGSRMPLTRMRQAAITLPARIRTVAVRCEPGAEPSIRTAREITVITIGALDDLTKLLARGALR
ncbi:MAG: DUF58 domain-containing protein [Leifsonia flava]